MPGRTATRRSSGLHGGTMKPSIQVLIADDRPVSRSGLRALLGTLREVVVVGEAADGQEAVRLVDELQPDVVLMDVCMPVLDGLEATRQIKKQWPRVRVVVISMYALSQEDVLAAGADSFLVKGCPSRELFGAIQPDENPEPGEAAANRRTQNEATGLAGAERRRNSLAAAALLA